MTAGVIDPFLANFHAMTHNANSPCKASLTTPPNFDFAELGSRQIEAMADAGNQIIECYRVLRKGGLNIVGELLRDQGTFYELEHYPKEDVFDDETHSQYYYHTHRNDADEHGHLHTFIRQPGMPDGMLPVTYYGEEPWPGGDQALTHLVAISMDSYGFPIGLFTTNRWVTGESWYHAENIIAMLDRFRIDHAYPSWPVNIWLTQVMILFRPQVEWLLRERDRVLAQWQEDHPDSDVYEDRTLDITSYLPINVEAQIKDIVAVMAD